MSELRILQLDASQASVHLWKQGTLLCEASFPADAAGATLFAAHLARQPDSHYAVLADVGDEGFQHETIPHVFGKSRTALLQRKLAQAFYGSPLTLALSLGREKSSKGTARRDDRVLLLGLTRPENIDPWLAALRSARARLSGLYSAPLLSAVLARRHLREQAPQFMLVTLGRAGIRLCFFETGKLRFSHLGSPPAASDLGEDPVDALAASCAHESARLAAYLQSQRLISRDAPLPCLILAPPDHHSALAARCVDTPDLSFRFLDLSAICKEAGLSASAVNYNADSLFLHLTATHPPAEQFAPEPVRHLHRLWQARRRMLMVGVAFLGACLLWAGAESWLAIQANGRAVAAHAQAQALAKDYRTRLDALPPLPSLPENLRALAGRYRALENRSTLPGESFILLSRILEGFPEVSLQKLEWVLSSSEDGSEAKPSPGTASSNGLFVVTTLHATLPAATGLRQQIAIADAFHAALSQNSALRVQFLKRPLSMEPGRLLRGSGDLGIESAQPEFSLRISRPL